MGGGASGLGFILSVLVVLGIGQVIGLVIGREHRLAGWQQTPMIAGVWVTLGMPRDPRQRSSSCYVALPPKPSTIIPKHT